MNRLLILVCSIILLIACQNEEQPSPTTDDYLVFGHFYGFCMGETCIEIFKLSNTMLSEDQNDIYPPSQSGFYEGDFVELETDKFEIADGLFDLFPSRLLNEEERVIGMPDAGDWGGLYIEYKLGDIHQAWLLDQMEGNVPNYLHDFINACNERIERINE